MKRSRVGDGGRWMAVTASVEGKSPQRAGKGPQRETKWQQRGGRVGKCPQRGEKAHGWKERPTAGSKGPQRVAKASSGVVAAKAPSTPEAKAGGSKGRRKQRPPEAKADGSKGTRDRKNKLNKTRTGHIERFKHDFGRVLAILGRVHWRLGLRVQHGRAHEANNNQ